MSRRPLVLTAASLVVGLGVGFALGSLARAGGERAASLEVRASCEEVDPFVGPFRAPTGVRLRLELTFRSRLGVEVPSTQEPVAAAMLELPPRWTAYGETLPLQPVVDGALLGRSASAADRQALPGSDVAWVLNAREGRRRIHVDVLGPTDAAPASFSARIVLRDVDGALLERVLDDPCPLPAGPQHQPEGEG